VPSGSYGTEFTAFAVVANSKKISLQWMGIPTSSVGWH